MYGCWRLEPEFLTGQLEFKIVFKFPQTIKPPVMVAQPMQEQLTRRNREILAHLSKSNELSIKDSRNQLSEVASERTLQRDLAKLKDLNFVKMLGFANSAVWTLISTNSKGITGQVRT